MVLVLFSMSAAMAQTEYATWVFGTNAGLTFNNGSGGILDTPRVILNLPIDTREGSSSYSHPCVGSLTLYAMGETAYDATGRVLDNGTVLSGGSSSSQGALWVRDVSRPLSVYLFIPPDMTDVSATGTQHYTLNRAELGADGRWKMVERDVVLDPRPGSERIAATHDAAGTGYWVVTQYTDSIARNIEFVAYHVTMSGIDPVKVVSRFISSTVPHQAGIMKFSINGKRLAMTSVDDVVIGLYDFDPSSGVVSQQRQITLAALPEWQRASFCYGLTFTTSGNFLYTSVRALGTDGITRSSIVRLSVPLLNFDQNVVPEQIYAATLTNPYPAALQLGPNGKIYFTFNDNVGDMAYTDDIGVAVNSMAHRFPGVSQPRLGLPTCIESTFPLPTPVLMCDLPSGTISISDICEGGCTDITQNIQGSPTQWLWSFPGGRPATSTDTIPPRICYDTAGTYPVTLIVRNDAGAVQITDTLTVRPAPNVEAGPDVSICVGGQLDLSAKGAVSYRWSPASLVDDSTSATPRTVPLTQRTVFVVEGTGSDGCVGVDSVVVTPGVLQGSITPDTVICMGEALLITASGGTSCRWLDDAAITSYDRTVTPTTTTSYVAIVSDQGCSDTLRVTVSVDSLPTLTTRADTNICGGGTIELLAVTDAPQVRWEPADQLDDPNSSSPTARVYVPTQFIVTATSASGCIRVDTMFVNVIVATSTVEYTESTCLGVPVDILISVPSPITWLNGASEVEDLGTGLHRFTPIRSTDYIGTYNSGADCPDTVRCSISVTESRTIVVQAQSTTAMVGQETEFNVIVRTDATGGTVEVTLPALRGIVWRSPWDTPFLVRVESLTQSVSVNGLVLLNGGQQRTIDVEALRTDGCTTVESMDGTLVVAGCALESRHVKFTEPMIVNAIENGVDITGQGRIEVSMFDIMGRRIMSYEGTNHLVVVRPHYVRSPVLIHVTCSEQSKHLMMH